MNDLHYIGFNVHKKSIYYCAKLADGRIVDEGKLEATRIALRQWVSQRRMRWIGADSGANDAVREVLTCGTPQRNFGSRCDPGTVSRPAALP